MQYFGGKTRIAARIARIIQESGSYEYICEPFCGGCSVTVELAKLGFTVNASDSNDCLIAMWQEAIKGRTMPYTVTEKDYEESKETKDKALRGFVGHGCSFGGKWFGGFARGVLDYAFTSSQVISKQCKAMKEKVSFSVLTYDKVIPHINSAVYCDPPYRLTSSGYMHEFDSEAFSEFLENNWNNVDVFVSEYSVPCNGFSEIASFNNIAKTATSRKERIDRLFFRRATNS